MTYIGKERLYCLTIFPIILCLLIIGKKSRATRFLPSKPPSRRHWGTITSSWRCAAWECLCYKSSNTQHIILQDISARSLMRHLWSLFNEIYVSQRAEEKKGKIKIVPQFKIVTLLCSLKNWSNITNLLTSSRTLFSWEIQVRQFHIYTIISFCRFILFIRLVNSSI